ncbi:discoidin domain-containing protein [Actinoallomurus sp. NPDC052274]|uniref:discoidin domain-containing protein n=1 Tax=Actinoallomurus sp. NPDC052274 TaxID=3155420 RepID=UPI0034215AE4
MTAYRIAVSVDGTTFKQVAGGTWPADHTLKHVRFRPTTACYIRLEALTAVGGETAIAGQLDCGGTDRKPRPA